MEVRVVELIYLLIENTELAIPSIPDGTSYLHCPLLPINFKELDNLVGSCIGHQSTLCYLLVILGSSDHSKVGLACP